MKRGLTPLAAVAVAAAMTLTACGDDDTELEDVTVPTLDEVTVPEVSMPDVTVDLPETLPGGVTVPDVSLPDLSDMTLPDVSLPGSEEIEDFLRDNFEDLDDAQVECLADAVGAGGSMGDILDAAQQCDIEVSQLIPGG